MTPAEYEQWLIKRAYSCEAEAKKYEREKDYKQSALEYAKGHTYLLCLKAFRGGKCAP
ncbi:MAG: hypothetical protein WC175_04415 [Candidatus Dojkabacteria bacterium]|jgi:hypothetical protein